MSRFIFALVILSACIAHEPGSFVEYAVQRGDSLARIASRHDVTVDELREWNGLEGNLIHPGQVLRIQSSLSLMRKSMRAFAACLDRKLNGDVSRCV